MSRAKEVRPSGAATWVICSGYPDMVSRYPEIPEEADNEVREWGTAAHWLAAELWGGATVQVGTLAPNGVECDDEMFDCVEMYLEHFRADQNAEWYVERQVDCSIIYPGMKGTPDCWNYRPGWLRVGDLKGGFRFVEVWDNLQLVIYALAIATLLKLPDDTMVEMTIVQPRNYHRDGPIRTWTTKLAHLREKFLPMLREAAARAHGRVVDYVPNPGCIDCPGRHSCTSLQQSAYAGMEMAYGRVPLELTAEALGTELSRLERASKMIEARITGMRAQAEAIIRKGTVVPGWDVAPAIGRETWLPGTESQVMTLARAYFDGAAVTRPPRLITPKQARKVLPTAIVDMYAHKPSVGTKLVPQDKFAARKKFESIPS